jgi:hypothetical protein
LKRSGTPQGARGSLKKLMDVTLLEETRKITRNSIHNFVIKLTKSDFYFLSETRGRIYLEKGDNLGDKGNLL